MADITVNAVMKDVGVLWAWLCAIWSEKATGDTFTFDNTFSSQTFDSKSYLKSVVVIDDGTDETTYNFVIANTVLTSTYGSEALETVLSYPGFNTIPKVVPGDVGDRDNRSLFSTTIWDWKKALVLHATGNDPVNTYVNAKYQYDGGLNAYLMTAVYLTGAQVGVMSQLLLTFYPGSGSEHPYQDLAQENPMSCGTPGAPTGGGAVDSAGIIEALQDISLVDYDMWINNGADMFSVRGRIRGS